MVKKINEFKELQKKKGKKGFSMIELIIVLAIMAILVALIGTQLIPYLEKSREKRDTTTLDTCKTAFESVVADYEIDVTTFPTGGATIANLPSQAAKDDFFKYAGLKAGDEPFKSNKAGTSSKIESVTFIYSGDVLTQVKVGTNPGLSISTSVKSSS